jgi:hypothetical protein
MRHASRDQDQRSVSAQHAGRTHGCRPNVHIKSNSKFAAGTNLLFRPVNPELDRLKARKGKDAQLPVSDSASVKSGLDGDMSVAGDLEEGGVGKVGNHGATPGDVLYI